MRALVCCYKHYIYTQARIVKHRFKRIVWTDKSVAKMVVHVLGRASCSGKGEKRSTGRKPLDAHDRSITKQHSLSFFQRRDQMNTLKGLVIIYGAGVVPKRNILLVNVLLRQTIRSQFSLGPTSNTHKISIHPWWSLLVDLLVILTVEIVLISTGWIKSCFQNDNIFLFTQPFIFHFPNLFTHPQSYLLNHFLFGVTPPRALMTSS